MLNVLEGANTKTSPTIAPNPSSDLCVSALVILIENDVWGFQECLHLLDVTLLDCIGHQSTV